MDKQSNGNGNSGNIDKSWFGNSIHYWSEGMLPFTYAMACVEVVKKESEKARLIYDKIRNGMDNPDLKSIREGIFSSLNKEEQDNLKQELISVDKFIEQDVDKPFKLLSDFFNDDDLQETFVKIIENSNKSDNDHEFKDLFDFISSVFEFILIGFNNESDVNNGKYKVVPLNDPPWLLIAITVATAMEYTGITMDKLVQVYKIKNLKGKLINYEYILTQKPTNRIHRRIVDKAQKGNLKLIHDKKILRAAERWYQCRVVYPGIEKYCNAEAARGVILEPKKIDKEIRPCDDAIGYNRRKKRLKQ
jgi:hypothetical protein